VEEKQQKTLQAQIRKEIREKNLHQEEALDFARHRAQELGLHAHDEELKAFLAEPAEPHVEADLPHPKSASAVSLDVAALSQ
jgi:hypothetical protein